MASHPGSNRTQLDLDATVVSVELTLLSIIQGVVLYFLAEASREPVLALEIRYWPYVATGLLIVLLFWSRAMIHTFTLIRWPLEFGHNFLYITCALVQALMLGQVTRVRAWYALGALFSALVWVLFAYDLRLIHARMREEAGPAGRELFGLLRQEQMLHVRVAMPAAIGFHLACAAAVSLWPERLVDGGGHLVLVFAQFAGAAAYQIYVLRWYARVSPLILGCRDEWRRIGGV